MMLLPLRLLNQDCFRSCRAVWAPRPTHLKTQDVQAKNNLLSIATFTVHTYIFFGITQYNSIYVLLSILGDAARQGIS
jgi:hypothetical protein